MRAEAFDQQRLLTSDQFEKECRIRGIDLYPGRLSALHRAGLLLPLYKYDPSKIRKPSATQRARPYRIDVHTHYVLSGFTRSGDVRILYSQYQLLAMDVLKSTVIGMRTRKQPDGSRMAVPPRRNEHWDWVYDRLEDLDRLVIALSILEMAYLPDILHTASLHRIRDVRIWEAARKEWNAREALAWLGCDARWIFDKAEQLLSTADRMDPLRSWRGLVRLVRPKHWKSLRGSALHTLDHLIAAEMLLMFYEELVASGDAEEPTALPEHFYHPRHGRLGNNREDLDSVLMDYGLSPDPALVLVLEGQTEALLIPRVMDALGVPKNRSFIEVLEARSNTRDFGLLAAHVAKPSFGARKSDYVLLSRPTTRCMVVMDSEGRRFQTAEMRERTRQKWLNGIFHRLERGYQTRAIRDQLDGNVILESWGDHTFEFANFTDDELAGAILAVYRGETQIGHENLVRNLGSIRSKQGDISASWNKWSLPIPQKVEIAEYLWPVLEKKVMDAAEQRAWDRVPVLQVVIKAIDTASEYMRHSIVMDLRVGTEDSPSV